MKPSYSLILVFIMSALSCGPAKEKPQETTEENRYKTIGEIERFMPLLDDLIALDAEIEIIAEGFSWSEGPLWVEELNSLIFSEVPKNKIYQWKEGEEVSVYLEPSGNTDTIGWEGSNGLALTSENELVLAQHGDRRMALMNASITEPKPEFLTLTDKIDDKRFNSPNDLVIHKNGDIYFTDPPYGLPGKDEDERKELDYNGVYLIKNGETTLLVDSLTRPNGIGLSPDGNTLYVANSDPEWSIWAVYQLDVDGNVTSGKVFYDVTEKTKTAIGFPDGMKVHPEGYIFATGPGGVHIFNENAELLGIINTVGFVSNCAFNNDFSYLYMTVADKIMRLRLNRI